MTSRAELDGELRAICKGTERTPAVALADVMLTLGISFGGLSYLLSLGDVKGFSARTISRTIRGQTGIEWAAGQRIIRFCDLLKVHSRTGVLVGGFSEPYSERITGAEVAEIIFRQ